MSIEAMKQALEALDSLARYADTCELFLKETHPGKAHSLRERVTNSIDAITSLRQAIAEAEKQDDELQKVHSALACAIWDRMEVEELLFKLTGVKLIPKSNTPQPKQEQGEPESGFFSRETMKAHSDFHPQQRTWVGLTNDEILKFQDIVPNTLGYDLIEFAKAIEQALKDKNT